MTLAPGTKLGPYEILSPIGAGGMGEVYRAHDSRVGRDVAIKVSSEQFSDRFTREIHAVAALNHSNICTLYDVGANYLVMELVEGPTLADRIKQGPIPLEESLEIAKQIADALEAAHEKGIVHRDLKPGNIKIRPDGTVKVLDFGLAKVEEAAAVSLETSPTLSVAQTAAGVLLGTAAYMSPEQARGKPVDKRADIWAFGVVLYEMLTAKQLFAGETVSDTLATILTEEPDWKKVPVKVRPLLRRCLEKDPKKRLRDIGDVQALLESAPESLPVKRTWLAWSVASVLAIALGLVLWSPWRAARSSDAPLIHLDVDLGPDVQFGFLYGPDVIISPDGKRLAFVSKSRLFTRRLDQPKAGELAGTEGAYGPFFSPDSRWIAFFAGGKLRKISVEGGAAIDLCNAPAPRGGSWGDNDSIIAALNTRGPLSKISSAGGVPTVVTELGHGEVTHRWPQVLPGGRAVLFTAHTFGGGFDNANIEVLSLEDRRRKTIRKGGTYGRYLPSGHLLYVNQGTMFAVPFRLDELEARGTPSPVLELLTSAMNGSASFDFSKSGVLVFRRGVGPSGLMTLQWLDGAGNLRSIPAKPGSFESPRLSPDGKLLALSVNSGRGPGIQVYDLKRDLVTQLTYDEGYNPVWSPDGRHVVFTFNAGGMFWTRADGASKSQPLTRTKDRQIPFSFSPDGKRLAFMQLNPAHGWELWTVAIENQRGQFQAGEPEMFLQTSVDLPCPAFSPDGRWLAYMSAGPVTSEIYVRAFPDNGLRWQVSNNGGRFPVWSRNKRELFYVSENMQIMIVDYEVKGDSFVASKPRQWCEKRLASSGSGGPILDITPDGKSFLLLVPVKETEEQNRVTFLLNFFDELRRRVPTGEK